MSNSLIKFLLVAVVVGSLLPEGESVDPLTATVLGGKALLKPIAKKAIIAKMAKIDASLVAKALKPLVLKKALVKKPDLLAKEVLLSKAKLIAVAPLVKSHSSFENRASVARPKQRYVSRPFAKHVSLRVDKTFSANSFGQEPTFAVQHDIKG